MKLTGLPGNDRQRPGAGDVGARVEPVTRVVGQVEAVDVRHARPDPGGVAREGAAAEREHEQARSGTDQDPTPAEQAPTPCTVPNHDEPEEHERQRGELHNRRIAQAVQKQPANSGRCLEPSLRYMVMERRALPTGERVVGCVEDAGGHEEYPEPDRDKSGAREQAESAAEPQSADNGDERKRQRK